MSKSKNRAKAKTKIYKNFATVTKRLLELIDRGVIPWHQPWYSVGYQNLLSQKPYSGINPLLCTIDCIYHGHSSPYYIGKTQCNDRGWTIKKGSKANWLRWGGNTTVTEQVKDDRGQVQEKEKFIRAFKWLMVFNIDCIDDSKSEIKIKDFLPQLAEVTDRA
ncbi:MAG: ArdC family protein, partial [Waterburya sp.]